MKKTATLALCIMLLSYTLPVDKVLKVEMTKELWTKHFQKLQAIRKYVDESNLPHRDVVYITGALDSLMIDLSKQLTPQLSDTTKKK